MPIKRMQMDASKAAAAEHGVSSEKKIISLEIFTRISEISDKIAFVASKEMSESSGKDTLDKLSSID